jgi:hypothetical protein
MGTRLEQLMDEILEALEANGQIDENGKIKDDTPLVN